MPLSGHHRSSKRSGGEPHMQITKPLPNYRREIPFHRSSHLLSPSVNLEMSAQEMPWLPRQPARSKSNNFPKSVVFLWKCFKIRCPVPPEFQVSIQNRREGALSPTAMDTCRRATTWRGFSPATTTFSRTHTPSRLPTTVRLPQPPAPHAVPAAMEAMVVVPGAPPPGAATAHPPNGAAVAEALPPSSPTHRADIAERRVDALRAQLLQMGVLPCV